MGTTEQASTSRVLHVLQGLGRGGMERGTLQLAKLSRQHGHEDVLALYDSGSTPGTYAAGSVPLELVPRQGLSFGRFALRLAGCIRRTKPRIIHAHNQTALVASAAACALLAPSARPRLIGGFHNRPVSQSARARLATRWGASRSDRCVAVSEELAEWLVANKWTNRCDVIESDVDPDLFSPQGPKRALRQEFSIPESSLIIGHVGRFDTNKRQEDLIRAFRLVEQEAPDAALVFAGTGDHLSRLMSTVGADERVYFLGEVDDVGAFLRAIDVFVICSAHEGIPRSLLEAMACERACVARPVGDIPRVLGQGEYGLLTAGDGIEALAKALGEALTSQQYRASVGSKARARVVAAYSVSRAWEAYETLYGNLLRSQQREGTLGAGPRTGAPSR